MGDEILLFSGGMDSLIAWFYLKKPKCLFVDLDHAYSEKELKAVAEIVAATGMDIETDSRLKMGDLEEEDATIPARNMYFAMLACHYLDMSDEKGEYNIYVISQKGEEYIPDRSKEFFVLASQVLSKLYERNIKVKTPFWDMTKQDMMEWYMENVDDPAELIKMTIGCFDSEPGHCGVCKCCARRCLALAHVGITDDFIVNPFSSDGEIMSYYLPEMNRCLEEEDFEVYDKDRVSQTLVDIAKGLELYGGLNSNEE